MKKIDKSFLAIILIYIILYSFNMGGRWDLGDQIFIGYKCINTNIPLYSGTLLGKPMYNTSPYFPGVAFLSYPLKYLTNNLFFIEITNQLLKILGYNKLDGIYENFSNHSNQVSIIFPEVKNILKLEFDCNIYSNHIFVSTIQYFQIINYNDCFTPLHI